MLTDASKVLDDFKSQDTALFTYSVEIPGDPVVVLSPFAQEDAVLFELAFKDMCMSDTACVPVRFCVMHRGVLGIATMAVKIPGILDWAVKALDQYKERENV